MVRGAHRSPQGRPARLRDVAALAGVSVKTVSNVVNGYTHVSADTRAKVAAALAELEYRPNAAARNLRSGRSGIIALAVPELDFPYFAELARHVVQAARERDWTVLVDQTDGEAGREREVMNGLGTHVIDGLILSPLASGREALSARRDPTPMVLLGERVYDGPDDHVAIDNVAAARAAVTHLVELGRTRIATIGEQPDSPSGTARLRAQGYAAALQAAGLRPPRGGRIPTVGYHRADGAAAMARLLEQARPPDAVFCFNDLLALGALRVLHERGVRVPEDIAVVGFDDIEDGRYCSPSLTTVRPDKPELARLAVQLLAARITERGSGEAPAPPRELRVDFELVVRESTRRQP